MADKVKRGAQASASTSKKTAADPKTIFSTRLITIASEVESLLGDTDGLKEYGKLIDSQKALRIELSQKDQQIQALQLEVQASREQAKGAIAKLEAEITEAGRYHDRLLEDFQVRFRSWDTGARRHKADAAELARLADELGAARAAAETADHENRSLRDKLTKQAKKLQESQSSISTLRNDLQINELELKRSQIDAEKCRKTLNTLKDDLGVLPLDEEDMRRSLEDLATKSRGLVELHFSKEIANPSTPIPSTPLGRIPQVASNSPAALATRCAVAEAVIAQELKRHVFRDYFVPEDPRALELREFTKALPWLNEKHPREATIIRCQLARACYKREGVIAVSRRAAGAVRAILFAWLDGENAEQQLKANLESFFSDAVELWRGIQRTRRHVHASVDLADEWIEIEDSRLQYDSIALGEGHHAQKINSQVTGPIAVLFPRVLIEDVLHFHGYALFPTQSAVIAAAQEAAPGTGHRRRASYQARNGKGSSSGVNGIQPGMSSDLSFSERSSMQ